MISAQTRITEVGPRDGLQNEKQIIATADKARLIELLCQTGVDEIEVSSFVSPKWLPQLADAREVFEVVADKKPAGMVFSALVPNIKGLQRAMEINEKLGRQVIDKVSVFAAATESFSKRNTNATIAETIARFAEVTTAAQTQGFALRGYISCVVACPYEGPVTPASVTRVARALREISIEEIDLGDTIGAADPDSIRALIEEVATEIGMEQLTLHLHDTNGRAAACAVTAFELGVRSFDGAAGGLGGCPFASTAGRRAPGNIATTTLIHALRNAGAAIATNDNALCAASEFAASLTAQPGNRPDTLSN